MKYRYITYLILSIIVFATEIAIINHFAPQNFSEIPGASIIVTGTRCLETSTIAANSRCSEVSSFEPEPLPTIYRNRNAASHLIMRMRFQFNLNTVPEGLAAIYLPKISDAIQVKLNGQIVVDMGDLEKPPIRHWNKPVFVTVPRSLLKDSNDLEIAVSAYQPDGAMLHPFYVGPAHVLKPPYMVRYWATIGVTQLGMAFMSLSAVLFGFLFFAKNFQPSYGWLSLASVSAFVFVSHFAISEMPFSYNTWTITWNIALNLLLLSLYIFTARYLGLEPSTFERVFCGIPPLVLFILIFVPNAYILDVGGIIHISTMILGLASSIILLTYRKRLQPSNFVILFLFFSISLALGVRDWVFVYSDPTSINMLVSQYGITIMIVAYTWLAASDLIQSVSKFDQLNSSLKITVDEKTKELQLSFEKLAEIEKQRVVERERQRIMLDLHDGVGGQLVNTLAYMETQAAFDLTVQSSLEDILRDLSLMVDGLEAHDSLTTALGMLRSRLEPLLNKTDMSFDWQVRDEPITPSAGPSQNLNVLRIAQEAITNAVKHANASVIIVKTDTSSITITDNGDGFANINEPKRSGSNSGIGIVGMKGRAKKIGADLVIKSSDKGTAVSLTWSTQ